MAELVKITTTKTDNLAVNIDGNMWNVLLPGVGTEFRLSQAQREATLYEARLSILTRKIDDGTATEQDLDRYEEYMEKAKQSEQFFYESVLSVLSDGTKENKSVKDWMNITPLYKVIKAVEEIRFGIERTDSKTQDSQSS